MSSLVCEIPKHVVLEQLNFFYHQNSAHEAMIQLILLLLLSQPWHCRPCDPQMMVVIDFFCHKRKTLAVTLTNFVVTSHFNDFFISFTSLKFLYTRGNFFVVSISFSWTFLFLFAP